MTVAIFSQEFDPSTDEVIDWLIHYEKDFIRINEFSVNQFPEIDICLDNKKQDIKVGKFCDDEISSVFYRKNGLYKIPDIEFGFSKTVTYTKGFLKNELDLFYEAIAENLSGAKTLGAKFSKMDCDKFGVLASAKTSGLRIPNTIITQRKESLLKFYKENNSKIITKPIFNGASIPLSETETGVMYTSMIDDDTLKKIPDTFFPSLFQEFIEKEYELRIFYLDGKFYASALFMECTSDNIDYRNKNKNKTVRTVPYLLPKDIEERLHNLMTALDLNTGSIDVLKSKQGEYIFLEVNPVGQYEEISINCNYDLNKKIATWLIN
jgi:ATP-GRASP peptide maturase of grasp-with-spasm system